ncbi:MAG: energy transducer TonB [Terracidiphilus sp.]
MQVSRRKLGDFVGGSQDADTYNYSSLALDYGDGSIAMPAPLPQLLSRPKPEQDARSGVPLLMDLDSATASKGRTSRAISFFLHILVIAGLLAWGFMPHAAVIQPKTDVTPVTFTLYDPPPPPPVVMPVAKVQGGGGGGGAHQLAPPIKGHLPVIAKVHLAPAQLLRIDQPKLAVEPTQQVNIAVNNNMPTLGMTQSQQVSLASQGSGSGSGFGFGSGGGIGAGHGSGVGSGGGGGYGGGLMSVGGGVSAPQLIHSVDPDFTDDARRANYQGTVSIELIVDSSGNPQDIRIVRHLGMGLDQKAIEAVRQYKFKPSMYQGRPVSVQMVINVDFHLH